MKTTRFIACIFLSVLCGCAARSDVIVLDERLAQLEGKYSRQKTEIRKYGKNTDTREKNLRNQSASLRVDINALREEIQILSGRLEQMEFELNQEKKTLANSDKMRKVQLDRLKVSTDALLIRLDTIEKYLDIEAAVGQTTGQKAVAAKPKDTDVKTLSERELYQISKQSFDKGDFEAAREGFQELTCLRIHTEVDDVPAITR